MGRERETEREKGRDRERRRGREGEREREGGEREREHPLNSVYVNTLYECLSPCSRIQVKMEFVEMVIGRLRSDDIYNQVHFEQCVQCTSTT